MGTSVPVIFVFVLGVLGVSPFSAFPPLGVLGVSPFSAFPPLGVLVSPF